MKNIFLGFVFFFVSASSLFAQEKNRTVEDVGLYIKAFVVHNYNFKLNSTLTDMGHKKIPNILTGGTVGLYLDIKKMTFTMDLGVEGMYYSKTRILNFISNISAGYKLTLPKKQSLIFAGNIAYNEHNVYTYADKGNINFQNPDLSNPTMFHLKLDQIMLGPKITWRNTICQIGIGYDFGIIPIHWKSTSVNITNSPKERIDKIHFDIAVKIVNY